MKLPIRQVLITILLPIFCNTGRAAKGSKLLLFLMDGIRWDTFDRTDMDLPGFRRIITDGVKARYLIPDFPSLSYPNYYSIMTGLHVEDHGMVGNFMYDAKHREKFLMGMNRQQSYAYWWDDGEPLWVTAEKQGKKAHMYYWPGCEVTIRGVKSSFCKRYPFLSYPKIPHLKWAINDSLTKFQAGAADVAGIYVELPDKFGHKFGPDSKEVKAAMEAIDKEMSKLLDEIKSRNLQDDVNIMIFSDHGMASVSEERVVNITTAVDPADIAVNLDAGANTYIWPKEGKTEKVYNDLINMNNPHMMVFKKKDLPSRWFYKKHYRIAPIVVVAEKGWYIATPFYKRYYRYPGSGPTRGTHGYDNAEEDMRAVFLSTGPDINRNKIIKEFSNVNIYQVMCKLLDIAPSKHDGKWEAVDGLLVSAHDAQSTFIQSASVVKSRTNNSTFAHEAQSTFTLSTSVLNSRTNNSTSSASSLTAYTIISIIGTVCIHLL